MTAGRQRDLDRLQDTLGVRLDPDLLELALTHRSFAFEAGGVPTNERLEFLGDSVLGLAVTTDLYNAHPELSEGELAKMRASVVNARALAEVASALGIGRVLLLGRGEDATGGREKPSILADTMEAVIGATYLSAGLELATEMVLRLFRPLLNRSAQLGAALDWKTSLQELTSELALGVPEYRVESRGPDHAKEFQAEVLVAEDRLGVGTGSSKKVAEQQAAEAAWLALSGRPKG